VRSDTATAGRVRLVPILSVLSAMMVVAGGILVAANAVMHRSGGHFTRLGVALGGAGVALGLVTLLVFAFTRGRTADRRRSAGHRRHGARSHQAGRERVRSGAPPHDVGQPVRDGGTRLRREHVLDPTSVYSPGGLIDIPRDARAAGSAGPARLPGFYDAAGPPGARGPQGAQAGPFGAPMAGRPSGSGLSEDWPPGPPPRAGYQPGAHPPPGPVPGMGPGWGPPGPGGRPQQPGSPRQPPPSSARMRPGEAFRPPDAATPGGVFPLREGPPFREAPPFRPGAPPGPMNPPRDATPPRGSPRPGRFGPGPRNASGRPPGGAGYGAPTAPPAPPGPQAFPRGSGPAGPHGTFDGGYAQVIRATDHPVPATGRVRPPNPARPGDPAWPGYPTDAEVYVYRDASTPPGAAASSSPRTPAEDDPAYWYDLLADDSGPKRDEARGPFEPLLSSSEPSGAGGQQTPEPGGTEQASPDAARGDSREAPEQTRARQLEQLKDLYLTAEAIGEDNVDKHFDQLLAQQRELISGYFRRSGAAQPGVTTPRDGQAVQAEHQQTRASAGQATPPEGASVRTEPPRAW
jgi:hypothetical protein